MKKRLILLFLCLPLFSFATFYSQCGQDKYAYENLFYGYRNGVFIDIGAHDGVSFSNTCFFEREMGWNGICVEAIPKVFAQLQKNRKCILINECTSNFSGPDKFLMISGYAEMLSGLVRKYDPRHIQRIQKEGLPASNIQIIDVQCHLFNDLLARYGITHVNFLSIDTEGGELDILSTIDFDRFQIDVIAVENNYKDPEFLLLLNSKGFNFVKSLEQDMIFVNKNFTPIVKK